MPTAVTVLYVFPTFLVSDTQCEDSLRENREGNPN